MGHTLRISVSERPAQGGIVSCRQVSVRERFLHNQSLLEEYSRFRGALIELGRVGNAFTAEVAWTPPLSFAFQVPDAVSGTCTIICVTYSGDTKIGTKTCTLKLSVPASVKPSIGSLTAERVDGTVPSSWGIYVQSKSRAKLTVNGAAGRYGSSIVSYSISGGGFSSNASSFTTGYLNSYGSTTFTATVTDSRGKNLVFRR